MRANTTGFVVVGPRRAQPISRRRRPSARTDGLSRLVVVLAPGQVYHPVGNIDGVVGETLVVPGHQGHVHCHRQSHRSRSQFRDKGGVEAVHVVILLFQCACGGPIAGVPSVSGLVPHIGGGITHSFDQAPGARREVVAQDVGGLLRNVESQPVSTVLVGKYAQHRQQETQVVGHWSLEDQLPVDQKLQFTVDIVDTCLPLGHNFVRRGVAVEKGPCRYGQILANEREQLDDFAFDGLELLVKFPSRLGHGSSVDKAYRGSVTPAMVPHPPHLAFPITPPDCRTVDRLCAKTVKNRPSLRYRWPGRPTAPRPRGPAAPVNAPLRAPALWLIFLAARATIY